MALVPGGALLVWAQQSAAHPVERIQNRRDRHRKRARRRQDRRHKRRTRDNGSRRKSNNKNPGGGKKLGATECLPPMDPNTNQPTDLQQVINNAGPFSNIVLCAGVFLAAGLQINKNLSLIGAGSGTDPSTRTGLLGTNASGVLGVLSGNVFISNLTMEGASGDVPAIGLAGGSLTLSNVGVYGNTAGGIVNLGGTLHLTQGTKVMGNGSDAEGGGILHRGGTTKVDFGCLIQGNMATDGGCIFDATGVAGDVILGDTTVVQCNIPNNCAPANAVQNCDNSALPC